MKLEEYKKVALQRLNKTIATSQKEQMNYACMGLIEETGEIVAELRKPLFKGNFHEKALNIEEIKSELGDLIWYISLICKNIEINMEQIEKYQSNQDNTYMSHREKLIELGIELGKASGQIVAEFQEVYKNKQNNKQDLIQKISEQYANIVELGNQLNITIEEMLDTNLKKINSRYKENGEAEREK